MLHIIFPPVKRVIYVEHFSEVYRMIQGRMIVNQRVDNALGGLIAVFASWSLSKNHFPVIARQGLAWLMSLSAYLQHQ